MPLITPPLAFLVLSDIITFTELCTTSNRKLEKLLRNNKFNTPFLTRECAHAHERVIAIVDFSLGRSVGRLVGWLVGSVVNFRACAVNEF